MLGFYRFLYILADKEKIIFLIKLASSKTISRYFKILFPKNRSAISSFKNISILQFQEIYYSDMLPGEGVPVDSIRGLIGKM